MNSNLLDQEAQFQKEATKVLEILGLMDALSKYGKAEIVGSMALGTMTRRDIDIEVTVDELSRNVISEIIQQISLISLPRIGFTVIDNRKPYTQNLPNGLYIGITYTGNDSLTENIKLATLRWDIDIWFLSPNKNWGGKLTRELKEKITPEKRKIILAIKHSYTDDPRYKKTIQGMDIYNAVLKNGVKDLEEFERYLKTT